MPQNSNRPRFVDYELTPAFLSRIFHHTNGEDDDVPDLDPRTLEDPEALRQAAGLPEMSVDNFQWPELQEHLKHLAEIWEPSIRIPVLPPAFAYSTGKYWLDQLYPDQPVVWFTQQAQEFAQRDGLLVMHMEHGSNTEQLFNSFREEFGSSRVSWNPESEDLDVALVESG
jgi:hypothetical protein